MSLLTVPSELLQQILCRAVPSKYFPGLRLVHSRLNRSIIASAGTLTRTLIREYGISEHVLSLHEDSDAASAYEDLEVSRLLTLLRLHADIGCSLPLEEVLDTRREKIVAFPQWADVPARTFGSVESILIFAAFQRALRRCVNHPQRIAGPVQPVLAAAEGNSSIFAMDLDQHFMDFVRERLTVNDLNALITIVNFCAVTSRFSDSVLSAGHFFKDDGVTNHWQDEQLGSALLAEHILWRGPSWLHRVLSRATDQSCTAISVEQDRPSTIAEDRTVWLGSREDAVILSANGLARFLWKERLAKIALEEATAKVMSLEAPIVRADIQVDPAVWRGSSGGM